MLRPASRCLLRQPVRQIRPQSKRYLSTAPPHQKSRSWRNSATRWTLAFAGVYFYNTSSVFAEEPVSALRDPSSDEELPTLQSLSPSSRFQPPHPEDRPSIAPVPKSTSPPSIDPKASEPYTGSEPGSPEDLEQEAAQQGAFNEETGEINWDCPCLGGMAHGPCGPEFREAFSCFVFSKDEPKGMDCIDKFKGMQNCFREHPDVYGDELEDDEEDLSQEGATLANASPEDSGSAANGSLVNSIRERENEAAGKSDDIASETKNVAEQVGQQTKKATMGVTDRAVSAKDAIAEKAKEAKQGAEAYLKPEEGGHSITTRNDPNDGKKDGYLVKTGSSSGPVKETADQLDELVPKASHNATDENNKSKTSDK